MTVTPAALEQAILSLQGVEAEHGSLGDVAIRFGFSTNEIQALGRAAAYAYHHDTDAHTFRDGFVLGVLQAQHEKEAPPT